MKIYHEPVEYHNYVVAADIGEGVHGGARTAITVMDTGTCEEVARWVGITSPEDAGRKMADLGRLYNQALLSPEANNFGHSTLNTLINEVNYPHLYEMMDYVPVLAKDTGESIVPKWGWQTTPKTRPLMLSEFRYALQKGLYKPNDPELITECMAFVDNGHGKYEACKDAYDDRIFAHSIVWQIRKCALDSVTLADLTVEVGEKGILTKWDEIGGL